MVFRTRLTTSIPEEQADEVTRFLAETGLNPDSLFYRVFDSRKTDLVLSNGTDRTGPMPTRNNGYINMNGRDEESELYEQLGYESWDQMFGLDKRLKEMSLTREDGLWLCDNPSLQKTLKPGYVIVPGSVGVAVYDPSKVVEIGTEFYAFKHPRNKLDALVAVVSDNLKTQEKSRLKEFLRV